MELFFLLWGLAGGILLAFGGFIIWLGLFPYEIKLPKLSLGHSFENHRTAEAVTK
ncbi:hypothetical protein [Limisalsivibrio acetivorans]|uniref:hypothetical protein n=1 Tax=Limisalsivibrio acetivorans TaxID=1304888 RepID=UPI0003B55E0A|nr:hypothetical protein [Limisalsivibrio acetivorans]